MIMYPPYIFFVTENHIIINIGKPNTNPNFRFRALSAPENAGNYPNGAHEVPSGPSFSTIFQLWESGKPKFWFVWTM